MKRAFYLLAAGFLLASCEHKELCLVHPHEVAIEVKFDWRDAPQADPDGMCVYFYPLEGGGSRRVDFNNTTGGKVELDVASMSRYATTTIRKSWNTITPTTS